MYVHFFSWHPEHVKRSVLFSLLLRAYRICDTTFRSNELDRLYASFKKLRYPFHFVERVHRDVKRKFFSRNVSNNNAESERRCTLSLPYNELTKTFIRPILNTQNCQVAYKASNTIRSSLVKTKPRIRNDESAGIYSIPCHDCERIYIGQTGRTLKERLNEHKYSLRINDSNNALFRHMSETHHKINVPEAKMIFKCSHWEKRLIIESSLIEEIPNFNQCRGDRRIDKTCRTLLLDNIDTIKKTFPNR